MKNVINKALFYKEWINVRWMTLLTTVILLYFKAYGVLEEQNQNKIFFKQQGRIWTYRWFNNGLYFKDGYSYIMAFVIILLAIILFIGEKSSTSQGFIASMPFTRKEIILNKWIVGVLSILISFTVAYILLSLIYVININSINTALNPYYDIIKWFFMDTFQYSCIFTFLVLIQSVMGNSVVSGIAGGIILLVPAFITAVVDSIISQIKNPISNVYDEIVTWLNIYGYNSTHQVWVSEETNGTKDMYRTFYCAHYGIKLLILFLLTCLFLYLAYICYKKRNLEYNLRLIVFKNIEPFFIWGAAICSGLYAGALLGLDHNSLITFCISAVVFTIASYFILKLLIKLFFIGK